MLSYDHAALVHVLCALLPMRQAHGDSLRVAALGCLCELLRYAAACDRPAAVAHYLLLYRLGAPARLHELALDGQRPAPQRLAAARALEAVQLSATEIHAGGGQGAKLAQLLRGTLPEGGLERMMLALTQESESSLCALGCRGLARATMRGAGAGACIAAILTAAMLTATMLASDVTN